MYGQRFKAVHGASGECGRLGSRRRRTPSTSITGARTESRQPTKFHQKAKGCVCTIVDDMPSARTRKPFVLLVSQSRTERRAPLQLLLLYCCFFASFVLAFCTFAVEFTDAKVTFEPSFQLTRCRTCTTRATALTSGTRLVLCAPQRPDLSGAKGLIGLPRSGNTRAVQCCVKLSTQKLHAPWKIDKCAGCPRNGGRKGHSSPTCRALF